MTPVSRGSPPGRRPVAAGDATIRPSAQSALHTLARRLAHLGAARRARSVEVQARVVPRPREVGVVVRVHLTEHLPPPRAEQLLVGGRMPPAPARALVVR